MNTVTLGTEDYETVCQAVEVLREFVANVRDGVDYSAADINTMALFAAQAEAALDHVV